MEFSTESEKQHLIEDNPDTLSWLGASEEKSSDSSSEWSEDVSSLVGLRQHEQLCQVTGSVSEVDGDTRRLARRKLVIACGISLLFMMGEVIGGYAAHSLAIMTDAAHLLTDFGSILISIFSLWISSRPQGGTMTFGWHRAEILGMLLSVASVWAVTGALLVSAVQRLTAGDYDIDSHIMLLTSGCAVAVNILMAAILHQSGAPHGHAHGPAGGQRQQGAEQLGGHHHSHSNASVRAAFIHVLGDLVQSVGVLTAALVIHIWPEYKAADPICTFLFSVLVVGTTLPVTKDVFRILMEGTPQNVDADAVKKLLQSVRGVAGLHNMHMWSLNMNHYLISVHVAAVEEADTQVVLTEATQLLRSQFGFSGVTIQVERGNLG
ncbi:proton-coupled zinc antiporter SLC30A2-like [Nelusetta ayraudi]|uniref:proton-coupled zinc antiporter SLC30A2-like n=1 Tax=Nelusetta ayraudi TaxID=303726 RepID=UPI003F7088CC